MHHHLNTVYCNSLIKLLITHVIEFHSTQFNSIFIQRLIPKSENTENTPAGQFPNWIVYFFQSSLYTIRLSLHSTIKEQIFLPDKYMQTLQSCISSTPFLFIPIIAFHLYRCVRTSKLLYIFSSLSTSFLPSITLKYHTHKPALTPSTDSRCICYIKTLHISFQHQ